MDHKLIINNLCLGILGKDIFYYCEYGNNIIIIMVYFSK